MGVASEKRYCRRGENGAQAVPRRGYCWPASLSQLSNGAFGTAPLSMSITSPFLNIIMVGMLRIRKPGAQASRSASVLTFTKRIFAAALFRDIFKDRRKATAGSAPWRPEIDNDRQIVLQEFIQRCPGRVDDIAVKKIVAAASALCAIRATDRPGGGSEPDNWHKRYS